VIYEPPRSWWRRPSWLADLDKVAPELKTLLDEIYSATNDQQFRLLAMGVRTALDYVMTHMVGDIGSFEKKLNMMVEKGHLSRDRKQMLEIVIDAGSAAAHRGFKPATVAPAHGECHGGSHLRSLHHKSNASAVTPAYTAPANFFARATNVTSSSYSDSI
jgi:hypothetical protein